MDVKTNLPIIFLRECVLLPHDDIRLEFDSEDKKIIGISELYHDNYLLFINLVDQLEESLEESEFPSIGVVGRIKSKIELPNGIIRVVITGIQRIEILNYIKNEDDTYQAFVGESKVSSYDKLEANVFKRVLYRDLKKYISLSYNMSNSVLGRVNENTDISIFTDIVVSELPIKYLDKIKYIKCLNPITRATMIVEDIHKEIESVKLENEIEEKTKKQLDNTQREFLLKEKMKIIKQELGDMDIKEADINFLREKIEHLKAPRKVIVRLMNELNKYELALSVSPEVGIIRNYIDWVVNLPWGVTTTDSNNIVDIQKKLDENHYGLTKIKTRIIEHIMVKNYVGEDSSPIICLVGPPGTGKTSMAKSIASSLNKSFVKISVGGINDEAEIIGHRRTYIGACPGKIIQGLKKAKSNNPVFLIDEIDKMTKDYKGDPASALLDILDKEQNSMFCDNYIEEEFDLSNIMFILTANSVMTIPDALKDRLEIIEFSSYTVYEKLDICKSHLIPKLLKKYNLSSDEVTFTDRAILKIIRNYTKESGARELERLISTICRKIITNIMKSGSKRYNIDAQNIVSFLGKIKYKTATNEYNNKTGITNALAYTNYGGDVLKVSVASYQGNGKVILTGSIGDVMKESVHIALSYLKSNCKLYNIDYDNFTKNDFHIHFEEGSVPKDGPSAGVTVTTAIISLLTKRIVRSNISMSGEITLRGKVLPVGGIKEKLIAATINNINKVYLSTENKRDVDVIDSYIKGKLNIVYVSDYCDIYEDLFGVNL
ncbi:MAG: endopeptidase La [bacterium]|nr:endopeptidase La [bacterium]